MLLLGDIYGGGKVILINPANGYHGNIIMEF